ncbi:MULTISPECIES: 6-pyruvoyl trahydropterin synthase family protein [Acidianus]|jgi:6-pyruvoyltetrahydropterin/6-carboxytetrahydropterin synthase|uniref:6-pyruvoyl tetrahydrobiopterin synthase n=4 Tax=Acidianus TaxID=12914 RepID=A0A650CUU3_ACIAM|nr:MULTISPECIES: 6-carboxytetrahydropterin synthase [Acidianus]AEE95078.1 putative 6-pyruvoyl tetrahydropterin synthase [Acidianus hospitalis W1]MCY0873796.1 6-carboxytetrahydropterin synthase [Acidianus infernus]MCY0882961.1 6-carboxytetrahydropterin synthase [Acidianus infernus]MQL55836.1 6-pyruvoyl tetrahydrobiopterin synthase [Acidianus ambivalens]MUM65447.1 6-pyruvoyl tetrahydrobiopterin synthase [Acidianus infernus]
MKVKIGIEGFTIDSAHYTLSSPGDSQLHGHTYIINVEVEGNINPANGFVIDFNKLKDEIGKIIKEWDHKLIVPKKDLEKISISGPFRNEIKIIEEDYPTAEYIGFELAKEIYNRINMPIKIKIYEGKDSYAIIEYP